LGENRTSAPIELNLIDGGGNQAQTTDSLEQLERWKTITASKSRK